LSSAALNIPAPNSDFVEHKMSEFINLHPDRNHLRQLFVREGEGWYQFGTKRLNVKCENNLLKVRVGGGYCTIDDYVDKNLPFEVARLGADPYVGRTSMVGKSGLNRNSVSPVTLLVNAPVTAPVIAKVTPPVVAKVTPPVVAKVTPPVIPKVNIQVEKKN
jgi:hypothetical protein